MALLVNVVVSVVSMVFGGGTAILNTLLEAVSSTYLFSLSCVQCFDAVGWAAGRASGL